MQDLLPRAERISRLLKDRGETIVVVESSTGGLVSAALLAMPGAFPLKLFARGPNSAIVLRSKNRRNPARPGTSIRR